MNNDTIRNPGGFFNWQEQRDLLLNPPLPECMLPQQDADSQHSGYLTDRIEEIRRKGQDMVRSETEVYQAQIDEIAKKPNMLTALCTLGVLVAVPLLAYIITDLITGWGWALLVTVAVFAMEYFLWNHLYDYFYLMHLQKHTASLEEAAAEYQEKLEAISSQLAAEVHSIKETYFSSVVDAQFQFGKQNQGIGVLANWCCEQLLYTIRQGDHRKFLERIYAQVQYTVYYDRVVLDSKTFFPNTTPTGKTLDPKDVLNQVMFVLEENCIYNLKSDLFTLSGCAQALCSHITEKMDDLLATNGYNPEVSYKVESNDNFVKIKMQVDNPQFENFQSM